MTCPEVRDNISTQRCKNVVMVLQAFLLLSVIFLAGSCDEILPAPLENLTALVISGPSAVWPGDSAGFTAVAVFDTGKEVDVTSQAAWLITDGPGTISGDGVYTAPQAVSGDTVVRVHASYSAYGVTKQADMSITVTTQEKVLSAVVISGPESIEEGGSGRFTAWAVYSDNSTREVTGLVSWAVNSPGSISELGIYQAPANVVSSEQVTIVGSYSENGVTSEGRKVITLVDAGKVLAELAIHGPSTVGEAGSGSYTAIALYDDGSTADVTDLVTWSVDGAGSINEAGTYYAPSAVAQDTGVTIHASLADGQVSRQASMQVTVQDTTRIVMDVVLNGPESVQEGQTATYVAMATFDDGATEDVTANAQFTCYGPGSITPSGQYTAPSPIGADTQVTIHVSYSQGGFTREDSQVVYIVNKPQVMIGGYVRYNGQGLAGVTVSAEGGSVWVTGADGAYGVFVPVGWSGTITPAHADYEFTPASLTLENVTSYMSGHDFEATAAVSKTLSGLTISGPASVVESGSAAYTAIATFSDGSTADVSGDADWTVISGPGLISSAGVYAAPDNLGSDADAVLQAGYTEGGVTLQATKTIVLMDKETVLTGVSISGPATVDEGGVGSYTATASFSNGSTMDVTAGATWSITSGPGMIDTAGLYTAPGTIHADTGAQIAVSYSQGAVTKDAAMNITVVNSVKVLTGLNISGTQTVYQAQTASYVATASYDDGSTANVTTSSTWSISTGPGTIDGNGVYAAPSSVSAATDVTVHSSYSEGGVSKQASKDITVYPIASGGLVANPDTYRVPTDACKFITLTGTDVDGRHSLTPLADAMSFQIVSAPSHGRVQGAPPLVTYVPDPGFVGTDSFTFKAISGSVQSAPATITLNVMPYTDPVGIETPEFGIAEQCPPLPDPWTGEVSNFWYIDNTHPNATDTVQSGESNPRHGYPDKPRKTIPVNWGLGPGDVVIIADGDYYPGSWVRIYGGGTADNPVFIRGLYPHVRPRIHTQLSLLGASNGYIIFEYLVLPAMYVLAPAHHISIRHCEATGQGGSAIMIYDNSGNTAHDIVVYNSLIHDNGDWLADYDQDCHGVAVANDAQYIWILDNEMYRNSGNGVQVNAQNASLQATTHHVYIGRNVSHHNKQSGLWTKFADHVIFSQNRCYAARPVGASPSSPGEGLGGQYGPAHVWMLFNEIYDCDNGIRFSTDSGPGGVGYGQNIYIIGNLIYNIHHSTVDVTGNYAVAGGTSYNPNDAWGPGKGIAIWHPAATKHIVGNTIYDVDGGIAVVRHNNRVVVANNIIAGVNDAVGGQTPHLHVEHDSSASVMTVYNNLFEGPARIKWGYDSTLYDVAGFESRYGSQAWNNLEGDPGFVNPGTPSLVSGGLQISPGSVAIDAGVTYEAFQDFRNLYGFDIAIDISGTNRPQGGAWDLGAYER